jgi:hypothetical protein
LYPKTCPPIFVFRTPPGEFEFLSETKEKENRSSGKNVEGSKRIRKPKESLLSRRLQFQLTHQINSFSADLFNEYLKHGSVPSLLSEVIEWIKNVGSSKAANPSPIRELIPASCIISSARDNVFQEKKMKLPRLNLRHGGRSGDGGTEDGEEMGEGKLRRSWGIRHSVEKDEQLKKEYQYEKKL